MALDIYQLVSNRVRAGALSSLEKRQRIYRAFHQRIYEAAEKNGFPSDHPRVSSLVSQLEQAIGRIENEITAELSQLQQLDDLDPAQGAIPARALAAPDKEATPQPRRTPTPGRRNLGRVLMGIAVIAGLMAGFYYFFIYRPEARNPDQIAFSNNAIFSKTAGTGLTLKADQGNVATRESAHVRISSTAKKPTSAGHTGGAYIVLDQDVERQVSGRKIRVTIWARSAGKDPSPEFAVAYSTAAVGNSGWKSFSPVSGVMAFRFDYVVPKAQQKPGLDFLGIWADTEGKGRAVEILAIEISGAD